MMDNPASSVRFFTKIFDDGFSIIDGTLKNIFEIFFI